jgi:hypothetical protein
VTGNGVTFGDALFQVGKEILGNKFAGIYSENDQIPSLKANTGILINKPANVHWIAQYKDRHGVLHTYDSYSRKMGPNPVNVPTYFRQRGSQTDCGSRSLAWLYYKLN